MTPEYPRSNFKWPPSPKEEIFESGRFVWFRPVPSRPVAFRCVSYRFVSYRTVSYRTVSYLSYVIKSTPDKMDFTRQHFLHQFCDRRLQEKKRHVTFKMLHIKPFSWKRGHKIYISI